MGALTAGRQDRYGRYSVLLSLLALVIVPVFSAQGVFAQVENEKPLAEIRYPDSWWGSAYLQVLNYQPLIFSRDEDFGLEPPLANDSEAVRKELDDLKQLAKTERTEETVTRIIWENEGVSVKDMFAHAGLFVSADNDKANELIDMLDEEILYFLMKEKQHYARPRPNQLDPSIETVIPNPAHAAYPSGHAAQSYMVALLLSYMDSENKDRYIGLANEIAHRREIAGVHYASDTQAGQKMAQAMFDRLLAIPDFEKKLQLAAKSYIKPSATGEAKE